MEKETTQLLDEEAGNGTVVTPAPKNFFHKITGWIPKIFLQALTLTFLAEWGDRSQLATIILAAREVCSFCQSLYLHFLKFLLFRTHLASL